MGDAIKCSQKHVGDDAFAVLLGHTITKSNVPCTKQLMDVYSKYHSPVLALKKSLNDKIISDSEVENNIYKIEQNIENSSSLITIDRYILTGDIFDKINETEADSGGEIQLSDAISKLDSLYGVVFEGESYYIENRLDWLKTSIEFAFVDDDEFSDDLVEYMKSYVFKR